MQLIDFNDYEQNERMYGGTAGRKIGINYNGKAYLLKFPGNLKEKQMKNIQLSYSNSPVCEYIGSQIYGMLGIPVHETLLGTRNGKVVTACRDFLEEGDKLYEFEKIKVTFEPHFLDSNGNETNGNGLDFYEILMTIDKHPFFKNVEGVKEYFWDMFVVDALIGNPDRNNSNWGVIISANGSKRMAPVYDNGNCFNCKWDNEKYASVLSNRASIETEGYKGRRCIFEIHHKWVNPYRLILDMEYKDCTDSIKKITPIFDKNRSEICQFIDSIPVLSDVQKTFYKTMLEVRYEKVLCPVYEKALKINKEKKISKGR